MLKLWVLAEREQDVLKCDVEVLQGGHRGRQSVGKDVFLFFVFFLILLLAFLKSFDQVLLREAELPGHFVVPPFPEQTSIFKASRDSAPAPTYTLNASLCRLNSKRVFALLSTVCSFGECDVFFPPRWLTC